MCGEGEGEMRLFDSHCHLQDPRIYHQAPQIIENALNHGVLHFAVNGTSEKDWHAVKQLQEEYPSHVIPCYGLHPWFIAKRTPNWFNTLREFFDSTPSAAIGEIGLDKGPLAKDINFTDQVQVFRPQLELAKELERPVSIHCVSAFGDLIEIMQSVGPFPCGAILHSFMGSAKMVPGLAKLGAYFSFSGYLLSLKPEKAKKMLKKVPVERILLETDSPDGLPESGWGPSHCSHGDAFDEVSTVSTESLNQPANIVKNLKYVACLLEISEEELAEISYNNAVRLFSYPGSGIP